MHKSWQKINEIQQFLKVLDSKIISLNFEVNIFGNSRSSFSFHLAKLVCMWPNEGEIMCVHNPGNGLSTNNKINVKEIISCQHHTVPTV